MQTAERVEKREPLPDISQVEPFSEKDQACVTDIISVLRKHNALKRFGITLLHQHFPIDDDEVFLETCDRENRALTIRPVKKDASRNVPAKHTAWRLDSGKAVMDCKCEDHKGK